MCLFCYQSVSVLGGQEEIEELMEKEIEKEPELVSFSLHWFIRFFNLLSKHSLCSWPILVSEDTELKETGAIPTS